VPGFLTFEYYQLIHETSVVVIQACLVCFLAGLWIALFAFRDASRRSSASLLWCGIFALLFALWNLFFLSSYAQRDLEIWNTSLSATFSYRLYLAIGVYLPSVTQALLRRVYDLRYFLPNSLHIWSIFLAILILFIPLPVEVGFVTLFYGVVSFGMFTWINFKVWKLFRRAGELYQRTRGLFIGLGLSVCILFSVLGQLRAEGLSPIPLPYLGSTLTLVFLYFVWQMILHPQLRAIRELMLGGIRVVLLTVVLGIIFLSLLVWVGDNDPELFLFNTFLAAFIILNILEPVRDRLDSFIMKKFIVDRNELERVIFDTRRELRSARSTDSIGMLLSKGLKKSDRIFRCGLYLWNPTSSQFRLLGKSQVGAIASLATDDPLAEYFRAHPELGYLSGGEATKASKRIKELRSHLAFPVFLEQELMGFVVIRTALSANNPYTSFSESEIRLFLNLIQDLVTILTQLRHFELADQQQRFAALGEMSAALAHEIRNPLGAIQGATHLLASSPTLENSEDRECVRIMSSEIERLQAVVDQYLRFARKSENRVEVSITHLIKKSIQAVEPKALKTKTRIEWKAPSPDIFCATDPLKLEQVLINLLTNACEAFSQNLKVEVSDSSQRPECFRIRISDDGPGIPPHVLPNIFTPLFTTKSAGSGLGLPICKKIIDSLGGSIRVESRLGEGTTFEIELKKIPSSPPDLNGEQTEDPDLALDSKG
jgi:signal transduction histidine kinase